MVSKWRHDTCIDILWASLRESFNAPRKRGLDLARQVPVSVEYDGIQFEEGFRADLIVDDKVIVEVKTVQTINPAHKKQLLTYLRLTDRRLGLLINFAEELIRDGIIRVVNKLQE